VKKPQELNEIWRRPFAVQFKFGKDMPTYTSMQVVLENTVSYALVYYTIDFTLFPNTAVNTQQ
jgi:hypothetical protein